MKTLDVIPKRSARKSAPGKTRKLPATWQNKAGGLEIPLARVETGHQTTAPSELDIRLTTIAADIHVGPGNALFIRGEGEGLSWDQGVPMHRAGDSTWLWASTDVTDRVVFKLLLNDIVWAQGDNLIVEARKDLRTIPAF